MEKVAVCSQIHTKHINTLCGQNVELLNVKLAVHIVTSGGFTNALHCTLRSRVCAVPWMTTDRSNVHCCTADRAWRCVQADLLRKLPPSVSAVFIGCMYRFSVRNCKCARIRNTFHSCNTVDKPSMTKCRNMFVEHNETQRNFVAHVE